MENKKIVTIIGLGLIGSSILRAFNYYLKNEFFIKVYDVNSKYLDIIRSLEIANKVCNSFQEAVKNADLIFLAIPVGSMKDVGKLIVPHLKKGAIVTDTGSTKLSVIGDLSPLIPEDVFLIPSHPLAGTEHSGPESGFYNLFEGRYWIIIDTNKNKQEKFLQRI